MPTENRRREDTLRREGGILGIEKGERVKGSRSGGVSDSDRSRKVKME